MAKASKMHKTAIIMAKELRALEAQEIKTRPAPSVDEIGVNPIPFITDCIQKMAEINQILEGRKKIDVNSFYPAKCMSGPADAPGAASGPADAPGAPEAALARVTRPGPYPETKLVPKKRK